MRSSRAWKFTHHFGTLHLPLCLWLYCHLCKSDSGSNWVAIESQWYLLAIATKFGPESNLVREPQGFKVEEMSKISILILAMWNDF